MSVGFVGVVVVVGGGSRERRRLIERDSRERGDRGLETVVLWLFQWWWSSGEISGDVRER